MDINGTASGPIKKLLLRSIYEQTLGKCCHVHGPEILDGLTPLDLEHRQ